MLSGFRKFIKQLETDAIVVGIVGLIAGAIIILAIRFFTYHTPATHYHANFMVYMNGKREPFKGPAYYEEESVSSCDAGDKITPEERAHMHDSVSNLVHVHDHAVTWGQFFQNLGWVIDDSLVQTSTKVYVINQTNPIHFVLNGRPIINLANRVIGDQDKLVVSYGPISKKALFAEYRTVPSTAKQADEDKDPASCGGSAPTTTSQKFHHLF